MDVRLIDVRLIDRPEEPHRSGMDGEYIQQLAESILKVGLIQPITVRRRGYRYEVVVGDCRFAAVKRAELHQVACIVQEDGREDVQVVRAHENLHRRDLAFRDEARMVRACYESEGEDVDRVCATLNRGRAYVEDRLLFDLMPPQMQEAVDSGALAVGACRELMCIDVAEDRMFYLGHAVSSGASIKLCRSWRQAWELTRTPQDPTALGRSQYEGAPVPAPVHLPCAFCGGGVSVHEIVHLRTCKECAVTILSHRPDPVGTG
jgi:ParB/RepB/Spo0J family partition protein